MTTNQSLPVPMPFRHSAAREALDAHDERSWEDFTAQYPDLDQHLDPERFVSEGDISPETLDFEGEWWDEQADRQHEAMREHMWAN